MRVAWVIAGKELRQRLRDRSAFFIAFVAPTLLAAIISGAFGGGFGPTFTNIHARVAIADEDHSQVSKAFASVLTSPQLRGLITLRTSGSAANVRDLVRTNKASAGYIVPSGFQNAVTSGARADVVVVGRADDGFEASIAQAVATSFTEQVQASRLSVFAAIRSGASLKNVSTLAADAARERIPVQLADAGLATRKVTGADYFGPGMAMFFLFFIVSTGARSLFAEREQGTLPRILAAPAPKSAIILGKAAAIFVLGLVSMTTVFVSMHVLFGVHWGDPLAIAILTVLVVLALMSLTALVQTLAKTEEQAAAYGSVVGIVLALAGGNFFPLFQMPVFLQKLSALTPNGWALRGFTDIAYDGAKAANLLPNFAAIAAFVLICGSIAAVRARRIAVA